MPVVPQFESQGDAGQAFNAGQNAGMSLMERAQQMQQRGDQEARQKAIFDTALPLLQAKNQADIATAQATMAGFQRAQALRTKAADQADTAMGEFEDAQQLADWNDKADAMGGLQAKWAWMEQIPEYKPFVNAINDARIQAHTSAMADAKLNNDLDRTKMLTGSRETIAGDKLTSAEDIATDKAQSAERIATLKVEGDKSIETMKNSVKMMLDGGMAASHVADSLTKLADSEEKNAAMLQLTGDDVGFKARMEKAQVLRSRSAELLKGAQNESRPPAASTSTPKTPTARDIQHLQANPESAKYFDQAFPGYNSQTYLSP